jgi:hypothetical protein
MANLARGLTSAIVRFVLIGLAFPYAIEYFSPTISSYVKLPPSYDVWAALMLIGALYAASSFLQNAYSKGDYQWLLGTIIGGVASIALFTYLLLFLPTTVGSTTQMRTTGLLYLIYLAVALSYGYLFLDFFDARRSRAAARAPAQDSSPPDV